MITTSTIIPVRRLLPHPLFEIPKTTSLNIIKYAINTPQKIVCLFSCLRHPLHTQPKTSSISLSPPPPLRVYVGLMPPSVGEIFGSGGSQAGETKVYTNEWELVSLIRSCKLPLALLLAISLHLPGCSKRIHFPRGLLGISHFVWQKFQMCHIWDSLWIKNPHCGTQQRVEINVPPWDVTTYSCVLPSYIKVFVSTRTISIKTYNMCTYWNYTAINISLPDHENTYFSLKSNQLTRTTAKPYNPHMSRNAC